MSTGDQKCDFCGQWVANCMCQVRLEKHNNELFDKLDKLEKRIEALEQRFNETERKDNDSVENLFNIFKDFRKRIEALEKSLIDVTYLKTYAQEPEKPKEETESEWVKRVISKEKVVESELEKIEITEFMEFVREVFDEGKLYYRKQINNNLGNYNLAEKLGEFVKKGRQLVIEKVKEVSIMDRITNRILLLEDFRQLIIKKLEEM